MRTTLFCVFVILIVRQVLANDDRININDKQPVIRKIRSAEIMLRKVVSILTNNAESLTRNVGYLLAFKKGGYKRALRDFNALGIERVERYSDGAIEGYIGNARISLFPTDERSIYTITIRQRPNVLKPLIMVEYY